MHSALSILNTISSYAAVANIRYPILIEGTKSWCEALVESYFMTQELESKCVELYGELKIASLTPLSIKSGLKKLGQESDFLIIDISDEFNANAINAICGTVIGGGLVFFIQSTDSKLSLVVKRWLKNFEHLAVCLKESESSYVLPQIPPLNQPIVHTSMYRSLDQEKAVHGIMKVVTGHAKRPLVMTADRGRGKSSAIGIAIAELAITRKLTIGITAPQRASVDEIFMHAERIALLNNLKVSIQKNQLTINETQIIYIAPDELLRASKNLDLLCVDEAAAIPAPMLLSLIEQYSRMVFSTTINGYEGTGRGFEIKFKKQLAQLRPSYRVIEMKQPIRWNMNDPLELWLSSVFLLNHMDDTSSSLKDISSLSIDFSSLLISDLLDNTDLAQSLFSLLVSAHYQTSPNDWLSLLMDPTLSCWVGIEKDSKRLLCCTLLSKEGELDNDLINDIQYGRRRPKGHLAPVSLTQTLCIDEPALQTSIRVMRIAVAVGYQHNGIGSQFMKAIEDYYSTKGIDYLSTSFGSTAELNNFWNSLGFKFVRLGISKDKASGTHSLLAVKPLSNKADAWLPVAIDYFKTSFPEQLMSTFSSLNHHETHSLLMGVSNIEPIKPLMEKRINIFIEGGLGFELIQFELRQFVLSNLSTFASLTNQQIEVVITKVIQVQDWSLVVAQCDLVGRKNAERTLRESIKAMVYNLQCKS